MSPPDDTATLPGLGPRHGVPRLAPAVDWSGLDLNDEKGFVLSRVDGRTSLHQILLLSPFPEARTVNILIELFSRGVIDLPGVERPQVPPPDGPAALPGGVGAAPPPPAPAPPPPPQRTPVPPSARARANASAAARAPTAPQHPISFDLPAHRPPEEPSRPASAPARPPTNPPASARPTSPPASAVRTPVVPPVPASQRPADPPPPPPPAAAADRELTPEAKARIEQMLLLVGDEGSSPDPHQLLGVERGADRKTIKRAYRRLAKEFHPDVYFGKNLGIHARALQRVFNAIKEATEELDKSAPE